MLIHTSDLFSQFERNRHIRNPRELAQVLQAAEARLADNIHPDPYKRESQSSQRPLQQNIVLLEQPLIPFGYICVSSARLQHPKPRMEQSGSATCLLLSTDWTTGDMRW